MDQNFELTVVYLTINQVTHVGYKWVDHKFS